LAGLSLRHGLITFGRGWRIELCYGESAQDCSGTLGAFGDGTFGRSVAKIDVDDTHGFERLKSLSGGKIQTRIFELLFDGTVNEECQGGDERMSPKLHQSFALVESGSSRLFTLSIRSADGR
jgi:hypothetical protein